MTPGIWTVELGPARRASFRLGGECVVTLEGGDIAARSTEVNRCDVFVVYMVFRLFNVVSETTARFSRFDN